VKRNPHPTKKGPGRRHAAVKHGTAAKPSKGAGFGFVQHTADPEKKLRRANVKALGRRQSIKAAKSERRESLAA
jgi:hypothetical protein